MALNVGKWLSNAELLNTLLTSATEEKIENVIKCLNEGANVNERFKEYGNNTPLHIAVMREEKNVVKLLLEKGADITLKNNEGKTAMDEAKHLNTDTGRIIMEIIQASDKKSQEEYKIIKFVRNVNTEKTVGSNKLSLLQKPSSTTDYNKEESYETKLLSLILIRTLLNQRIDHFILGTRVQNMGALDDICLRYRENNKECIVFLQTEHIIRKKIILKDLWNLSGNCCLPKYFNSYLNIRNKFESRTNDNIFQGRYEDVRCHFIIYTTAKHDMSNKKILNQYSVDKTVREILSNGEDYFNIFQYKYDDEDIKLLTKNKVVNRMKQIGKKLYESTQGNRYKDMLFDKHFSSYHVVLVNTVIYVSATAVNGIRLGWFREEFLSSNDELLIVIREAFFKEAVRNTNMSLENLVKIVHMFLREPSVENISKLIQTVPTSYDFENNRLDIMDNNLKELFLSSLYDETVISHTTYSEALQIAVKKKLGPFYFKLPMTFGNVDINVNESDAENTLSNYAVKIENILPEFGDKTVIINHKDELDPKLIGNLLVFDEDSGMFKFNTHAKSLGQNAKKILNKLKMKKKDINVFKFKFNIDSIPKKSFEASEYDNVLAKDFFNNLWFYSQQVKEHEIEVCAKHNLVDYYNNKQKSHNTLSQLQTDVIFLKIHNEVQKWWLLKTTQAHYVSNYMQIFDELLIDLTSKTVLSMLNYIYVNEIRKLGIEFKEQAIQSLDLDTLSGFILIETANETLTATKLHQYLRHNNDYTFINFNCVSRLSDHDSVILKQELKKNCKRTLIIIYEPTSNEGVPLNDLLNLSLERKIILVINEDYLERVMKTILAKNYVKVKDEKNNLRDLTFSSQAKILQRKLIFQGMKVSFEKLIDTESQHFITANILHPISNNKTIEIGTSLSTLNYEQIKYYYVQRPLYRSKKIEQNNESNFLLSSLIEDKSNASSEVQQELIKIKTLEDIKSTVLLMAEPGMGKSTLLTHLSIETKINNPRIWIERIYLIDHATEFSKWQKNKLSMDHVEALRFLCETVLSKQLSVQNMKLNNEKIYFDIEVTNGILSVKNINVLNFIIQFELQIFIHCYNKGNMILIFEGFHEICPHYKNIVLDWIKCLAFKTIPKSGDNSSDSSVVSQKLWITSRSYDNIKESLEAEFGISYSLKPFTDVEQKKFLEKYLRINLNLKNLNYQQFQKIDCLFEYMVQFNKLHKDLVDEIMLLKPAIAPLHNLYCAVILHLQREIVNAPISIDQTMYKAKWSLNGCSMKASELLATWNHVSDEAMFLIRAPLHVYVAVIYFVNQITGSQNSTLSNQWDFDSNAFAFYEKYLEVNLKNRRFKKKDKELHKLFCRMKYENELVDLVTKHKQLAFYSIFRNEANKILDSKEIDEIQQTIGRMENSEKNTEPKENMVLGVPKFVHLTFAEYLAVEYIIDFLGTGRYEKQIKIYEFVLGVVLPRCSFRILEILDRKVNFNSELKDCNLYRFLKEYIEDSVFEKFPYSSPIQYLVTKSLTKFSPYVLYVKSPLDIAVYCGMTNFAIMLLTAITDKVTEDNLDKFINFINKQYFFMLSIKYGYNEILTLVLDCVRRVDNKKMHKIGILKMYRPETKLPGMGSTNEEIIDYLKATLACTVQWKVRRPLRPTKLIKNVPINLRV